MPPATAGGCCPIPSAAGSTGPTCRGSEPSVGKRARPPKANSDLPGGLCPQSCCDSRISPRLLPPCQPAARALLCQLSLSGCYQNPRGHSGYPLSVVFSSEPGLGHTPGKCLLDTEQISTNTETQSHRRKASFSNLLESLNFCMAQNTISKVHRQLNTAA